MVIAVIAAIAGAAVALLIHAAISNRGGGLTQERVLAEAVNSYSDTGQFFLVAANERPFTPVGYYPTRAAADSATARAGAGYGVHGPYRGPATRDPWQILSISVRVRTGSGEQDLRYDPRSVDAVFLSMSAVRKFMLPYYRRVYGSSYADAVEAAILAPTPPKVPTPPCHTMSVPCTFDSLLAVQLPRR
jgi:hypothetical protein